jgi:hypothetical protein
MKKKCLIVFSIPHIYNWEKVVIKKFEIIYNVEFLFANEIFNSGGSYLLKKKINEILSLKNIDVVVFDTDFLPFVDANIIDSIPSNVYKILITFDNIVHSTLNLISGSFCDLVLTYDPLDVLKFRENNIKSLFFTLEDTKNSFKYLNLKKEIDVLFYGDINKFGRKEFIHKLKCSGVNIFVVGPPDNIVSDDEIVELINKSKIVLNLSFSSSSEDFINFFPSNDNQLNRPLLQFKGRFLHAGLCNTVCISEYAPSIGLIYSSDELPTFTSINECVDLIIDILNNDNKRIELSNNLHKKVINAFDDEKIMFNIYSFIESNRSESSIRKFAYNAFYKRYVTRFKISWFLFKPKLLFFEVSYLIRNNLFKFTLDFIPFFLKRISQAFFKYFLKYNNDKFNH